MTASATRFELLHLFSSWSDIASAPAPSPGLLQSCPNLIRTRLFFPYYAYVDRPWDCIGGYGQRRTKRNKIERVRAEPLSRPMADSSRALPVHLLSASGARSTPMSRRAHLLRRVPEASSEVQKPALVQWLLRGMLQGRRLARPAKAVQTNQRDHRGLGDPLLALPTRLRRCVYTGQGRWPRDGMRARRPPQNPWTRRVGRRCQPSDSWKGLQAGRGTPELLPHSAGGFGRWKPGGEAEGECWGSRGWSGGGGWFPACQRRWLHSV